MPSRSLWCHYNEMPSLYWEGPLFPYKGSLFPGIGICVKKIIQSWAGGNSFTGKMGYFRWNGPQESVMGFHKKKNPLWMNCLIDLKFVRSICAQTRDTCQIAFHMLPNLSGYVLFTHWPFLLWVPNIQGEQKFVPWPMMAWLHNIS